MTDSPTPPPAQDSVLDATGAKARVARVYAEALEKSAGDQADALADELEAVVSEAIAGRPEVVRFLNSAAIHRDEKLPLLASAFEGHTSEIFRRFVGVLNHNRRLDLLPAIAGELRKLRDKAANKVRVRVTAATELDEAQRQKLDATLQRIVRGTPVPTVTVDPDILGGLVVQVGDTVYDTSVRTRLNNLRTYLMASGTHG